MKRNLNIFDTARYIYQTDGLKRFWSGASIIASGCIPAHAAYFSVYEFAKKKLLLGFDENWHPYIFGLTGVCAAIIHDSILAPIDSISNNYSSYIIMSLNSAETKITNSSFSFEKTYTLNKIYH